MGSYVVNAMTLLLLCVDSHASDSDYLFVWAADADKKDSDFIAVLDANSGSRAYGTVLATVEVGLPAGAHHSEHQMPPGGQLFVNGFESGHSFVVNLQEPLAPKVEAHFTDVGAFSYPHSFERLPNGNVLATFQNARGTQDTVGGVVELSARGQLVRSASAEAPGYSEIRPYSLTVLPDFDRVVSTTTDMRLKAKTTDSVQFWRVSDLQLMSTVRLPAGPRGDENQLPAEPRLMTDGETLLVNTFMCGLYQIDGFASDRPEARHLYTFEMNDEGDMCALPVTVNQFWVQTVPSRNGLVTLDMSETRVPREVGYVFLGADVVPHWISLSPDGKRIVVTGFGAALHSVIVVNLDPDNGGLEVDRSFGDDGTVDFGRTDWPHGSSGPAIPHGSVFSLPDR